MDYMEAKAYMEQTRQSGTRPGLETITELLRRLGNPEQNLKVVHVAGTNGKGSTCTFLANILAQAGYTVGRYISPVVEEFNECIQVMRRGPHTDYITKESIASHITAIRQAAESMVEEGWQHPTYYEMETAMAMLELCKSQCDIVVLETLMGGELDATNVIKHPLVTVFTSISMDHMQYLGNTLPEIALVKAGIMKEKTPVVMDAYPLEVRKVLIRKAQENNSTVAKIDSKSLQIIECTKENTTFLYKGNGPFEISLVGNHQIHNASLAILCCEELRKQGYRIPEDAIVQGLALTRLFGRFSVVTRKPYLIVDGAHNPDAVRRLKETLRTRFADRKGIFIMGVFADKDYEEMLQLIGDLPKLLITITAPGPRGLASSALADAAKKYCSDVVDGGTLEHGFRQAMAMVDNEEYILCFGSLSYLGQVPTVYQAVTNEE